MAFNPDQPRDKEGKWARVKGALRRIASVETAVKVGAIVAGAVIVHSLKNQQRSRMNSVRDEINKKYNSPSGPRLSMSDLRAASNRANRNFREASSVAKMKDAASVASIVDSINMLKNERSANAKHAASMKSNVKRSISRAKSRIK